MTADKVTTQHNHVDVTDPEQIRLIQLAREADAADHNLTIRQALIKYKKAVFWAMFLSLTLWMEGFDLVLVSIIRGHLRADESR